MKKLQYKLVSMYYTIKKITKVISLYILLPLFLFYVCLCMYQTTFSKPSNETLTKVKVIGFGEHYRMGGMYIRVIDMNGTQYFVDVKKKNFETLGRIPTLDNPIYIDIAPNSYLLKQVGISGTITKVY